MSVRRVSIPDFGVRSAFEFTVDMVAVDPLRYGPEIVASTGVPVSGGGLLWPLGAEPTEFWDWGADGSSGRLSLTNDGTAAVWPSLTVEGGLGGGFVATNVTTGESIRFVRPIPAGSSVTINQRTGMASIDGQSDVSGFITERGFRTSQGNAPDPVCCARRGHRHTSVHGDAQSRLSLRSNYGYSKRFTGKVGSD